MYHILSFIKWYSFKNGVYNLVTWLPTIWKDRDFDKNYLYRILHKKLEKMEKFFRSKYAYTACAPQTADKIKEAKEIVRRLMEDSYFTDLTGDLNTEGMFSIIDGKWNINRKHPHFQEWEDAFDLSYRLHEEDKRNLFVLLRDNVDNWWD